MIAGIKNHRETKRRARQPPKSKTLPKIILMIADFASLLVIFAPF
jgi:DNA segregation ATPase FtsK/SpoIIIE-like protein